MRYTGKINDIKTEKLSVTEFFGIDESKRGDARYLHDMSNMRTDGSGLCVRGKRATVRHIYGAQGIFSDGTVAYVSGRRLYYGGAEVPGLYLSDGEKTLCRLGRFLMVFPDGVYCDLSNMSEYGNMHVEFSAENATLSCVDSSLKQIIYGVSEKEPNGAAEGDYCAVSDGDGYVMKRFDGTRWTECECFIKLACDAVGAGLNKGDTVSIDQTGVCDGVKTLYAREYGALYFRGILKTGVSTGAFTVKREVPLFDHVCVSGERLYGVRRGYDRDGRLVCRMYASAKGDPFTFFADGGGTYTDLEISGGFTGMCDMAGNAVAFGENDIVEGYIKSGALIATVIRAYGVEKGAHKSIFQSNGLLYYKSGVGICVYDGSYPKCISHAVSFYGKGAYGCPAVAAKGKYYIKLAENTSKNTIYIYDVERKAWSKQDDPGVVAMVKRGENIYMLLEDGDLVLSDHDACDEADREYLVGGDGLVLEEDVPWMLETQPIGFESLSAVGPTGLCVRLTKPLGTAVTVSAVYDSDDRCSESVATVLAECYGAVSVPLRIKRCDSFRIKIVGSGECTVGGIEVTYRAGGASVAWKR